VRVFKSDPPIPGFVGKVGRNDFHAYPPSCEPKPPVFEDDPMSSSSELSAGGRVKTESMTIGGKPRVVSCIFALSQ